MATIAAQSSRVIFPFGPPIPEAQGSEGQLVCRVTEEIRLRQNVRAEYLLNDDAWPEDSFHDSNMIEPSSDPNDQDFGEFRVRIPPLAYLKTCWLLFWNTIRHPFRTTVIDLMTGRVVVREE
jgi:hypothetical protein